MVAIDSWQPWGSGAVRASLAVLCALAALAGSAAQRPLIGVEFTDTPAPTEPADMLHSHSRSTVVLRYADGTPAMAEAQAGLGTILLCNFSVSELSSNIARQRLFPGWVHDLLANMSASGGEELEFLAGDRIYTEAWASEALGRAIVGPDQEEIPAQAEIHGERLHLNFLAAEPGSYVLPGAGGRPRRQCSSATGRRSPAVSEAAVSGTWT